MCERDRRRGKVRAGISVRAHENVCEKTANMLGRRVTVTRKKGNGSQREDESQAKKCLRNRMRDNKDKKNVVCPLCVRVREKVGVCVRLYELVVQSARESINAVVVGESRPVSLKSTDRKLLCLFACCCGRLILYPLTLLHAITPLSLSIATYYHPSAPFPERTLRLRTHVRILRIS